jgi:protocatechuate 3,4-dioxygenase beta subunit
VTGNDEARTVTDTDEFEPRDRSWHPPALTPAYKTSITRSPAQPLLAMPQTPSETAGPVFAPDNLGAHDSDLLVNYAHGGEPIGERIIVHGRVTDGAGRPVSGALVEIWQANAGGRYRHLSDSYLAAIDPNFGGCGRCLTGADGSYAFRTVKPGAYPWPNSDTSWRPPHIHFSLFGTAFCQRLVTQMYFEGDPLIALCPIVNTVPDPEGVARLVASLDIAAARPFDSLAYRFDLVLRGPRSTIFENRLEGN